MKHLPNQVPSFVLALALSASSSSALLVITGTARASSDPDALVWAARTCYLEASFSETDCIALLWVARKKAQRVERPWLEVLREYSSIRVKSPRADEVRTFPWGEVPGKSEAFNRRWQALRELVVEFEEGAHRDPCPRAEHWGGRMDDPQGRMIPARCSVSTANKFYAIGARSRFR